MPPRGSKERWAIMECITVWLAQRFNGWQIIVPVAFLLFGQAGQADSGTASAPDAGVQGETPAMRIEAAPGGGEMIFSAPARDHRIRARLGADGTPSVDCEHDETADGEPKE